MLKEAPPPACGHSGFRGPGVGNQVLPGRTHSHLWSSRSNGTLPGPPGLGCVCTRKAARPWGAGVLPGHSGNMGRQPPLHFSPRDPCGRAHLQHGSRSDRKPALASQGLCFRAPLLRLPRCQELQLHQGLQGQGAGSTGWEAPRPVSEAESGSRGRVAI